MLKLGSTLAILFIPLLITSTLFAGNLSVVGVSPQSNSVANTVSTAISVDFDEAVDTATITDQSFWAFGRWSGPASGTITFSNANQTVTLTPDQSFSAGENVMVILSHDILAASGNPLRSAGYSFLFWVSAQPSTMVFEEIDEFSTRTDPFETTRSYGGVGSDLNNDGYLDLAIVNEDTADLRVWLNLADGTGLYGGMMDPPTAINYQGSPNEPTDFNRDGNVDIVVSNGSESSLSILLGNGDGTFQPQQEVTVGSSNRGVAVLDVDGDGDIDIVNANSGSGDISLLINDGSGVFGPATFFDGGVLGEWPLSSADFDNDGILDFAVGGINSQSIAVHLGNGDGTFTLAGTVGGIGNTWMFAVGDVDLDGNVDVASANSSSNEGSISFGDGNGGFTSTDYYSVDSFPIASDLGDLDGDGDLDWILSSFGGDWAVLDNDGTGNFTLGQEFPAVAAASCAILLDIDNDGDLDAALIDELADTVTLLRQTGPTIVATPFVRGDCNGDASGDIGDAIHSLDVLFGGGFSACDDACDFNDDGSTNIADPIYYLAHLFESAPPPPAPNPACGTDPTIDAIDCTTYAPCP